LWAEIQRQLESRQPSAHPQTQRFRYPDSDRGREFYLKIYYPSDPLGTLKDLFRDSRAVRALKQGEALSQLGLHVPAAVAAGEERSFRWLRRAFLLALSVEGMPLPLFLRSQASLPTALGGLKRKRGCLRQLAVEVRRLHQQGFVHGDLVPSNILVRLESGDATFFYIDHDRTRRYPPWFPHRLWRRNLVQLNRFVLPGISLQDRMRFLRSYVGGRPWSRSDRRLIRWLEAKTRQRRQECDRIEAQVSFRELMRWNGPFAKGY
jgi:serine/threonine protein kinase